MINSRRNWRFKISFNYKKNIVYIPDYLELQIVFSWKVYSILSRNVMFTSTTCGNVHRIKIHVRLHSQLEFLTEPQNYAKPPFIWKSEWKLSKKIQTKLFWFTTELSICEYDLNSVEEKGSLFCVKHKILVDSSFVFRRHIHVVWLIAT